MTAFPHLFSPLKLGSLTLRNRFVMSPHTTVFAERGRLTQREADYQAARARGGVALTVLGTNVVHPSSPIEYGVLANLDDSYIPGYRLVADAVHAHGACLFVQLNHLGASVHAYGAEQPLQAPSPIPSYIHGQVPHEMETDLIQDVVRAFAAAAARCQRAGVDGALIHSAHGFLLNAFLSPLTNRRTDEYGGSLDNRMRLLLEVLASVRQATGRAYPVGVRLTVDELVPGGLTLDQSIEIVRRLDQTGSLDYLDVTCGVDYDWMSHGIHYPGMQYPAGTWTHLAAAVKAAVSLPVSCAGRIRGPAQAEELLASGKVDLVQMARALIADPELPNKAREGRFDEIRTCMYISSGCLGRLYRGLSISCVQNPAVGREGAFGDLPPANPSKRVVVVGGGPAGLEAATIAQRRGHRVVVFERQSALGGQMRTAALGPGRGELMEGVRFLEGEARRLDVDLRLGVEATADAVLAEHPDAVVIATGSTPLPFDNAARGASVFSVQEVLLGQATPGKRVFVIDGLGRIAASSAAEMLAASGHQVTLLSRDFSVAINVDQTTRPAVIRRLHESGVHEMSGTEVRRYEGTTASLRDTFTGREWSVDDVDSLVYDLGGRADDRLYHELRARGVLAQRIGDCLAPRGLEEAYHEGFRVAFAL